VDRELGPGTDLVYDFCGGFEARGRHLPRRTASTSGQLEPMAAWPKREGERAGWGWRLSAPAAGAAGTYAQT